MNAEFRQLRKAENWNESEFVVDNDFKLLENAEIYNEDQTLIEDSFTHNGERPRRVKGMVNKMDQTCIDTDDDDKEFESARVEEEEDNYRNDTSAFMVSRTNASRFMNETVNKGNNNGPNDKKPLIPNKILDSMILKYSEADSAEE